MNVQFCSMERQNKMWINFDLIDGQTGEWWMALWKHQMVYCFLQGYLTHLTLWIQVLYVKVFGV